MASLIPFEFEGASVRVVEIDGEPWFVGKDVAERLGYTNPNKAMNDHCKGVTKRYPLQTAGGTQEVRILSEPDVLRLIVKSNLPAAERFERFVFEDVLPTIRRTGSYGAPAVDPMALLNDPEALRGLLLQNVEKVIALEARIEADKPKTGFYDQFANADGLYGLQNAGRALNARPNLFCRWLKREYLFYQGGNLVPRVRFMQMDLFEVKSEVVDGRARPQTFIMPKGLQYLSKRMPDEVRISTAA